MRTYVLPPEGNLYKVNLHCHTTVSDGKFSPSAIKALYQSRAYHAVAFTDHQFCIPHPDLTDENFVALTGIEIACGLGKATSIHACGIARDPMAMLEFPNRFEDDIDQLNAGIRLLNERGFITTLNHPRWSGIAPADIDRIEGFSNMEVVNGYEMMMDGYGDSSACYEAQLRAGRKIRPVAGDDSHGRQPSGAPGHESFQGFTMVKAPALSYSSLIGALDSGAFYASTGPVIENIWLEDGWLHLECSPVRGVYVHGNLYRHRMSTVTDADTITRLDLDIRSRFSDSDYLFLKITDARGGCAWAPPLWL